MPEIVNQQLWKYNFALKLERSSRSRELKEGGFLSFYEAPLAMLIIVVLKFEKKLQSVIYIYHEISNAP